MIYTYEVILNPREIHDTEMLSVCVCWFTYHMLDKHSPTEHHPQLFMPFFTLWYWQNFQKR